MLASDVSVSDRVHDLEERFFRGSFVLQKRVYCDASYALIKRRNGLDVLNGLCDDSLGGLGSIFSDLFEAGAG
jgi:hypothetical protein